MPEPDAPTRITTSHAHTSAERWPTTTLWNRDEGCPGEPPIRTALGPSAANNQGCDVASVNAPTTRIRIADIAAPQAASLATNRVRAPDVFTASRRCSGNTGAIRVGPVMTGVGVGIVGVFMVSAGRSLRSEARRLKDGAPVEAVTKSVTTRL